MLRKLSPGGRDLLLRHLMRLTDEDRYHRFCGVVTDVYITNYCRTSDGQRRIVVGYWLNNIMCGAGEIVFLSQPLTGGAAEIALSVESPFQNRGIGNQLLRCLLLLARNRNLGEVKLITLPGNQRLLQLVRKFQAKFSYRPAEIEVIIQPGNPTAFSLLQESLIDGLDLWWALLDFQRAMYLPHQKRTAPNRAKQTTINPL